MVIRIKNKRSESPKISGEGRIRDGCIKLTFGMLEVMPTWRAGPHCWAWAGKVTELVCDTEVMRSEWTREQPWGNQSSQSAEHPAPFPPLLSRESKLIGSWAKAGRAISGSAVRLKEWNRLIVLIETERVRVSDQAAICSVAPEWDSQLVKAKLGSLDFR